MNFFTKKDLISVLRDKTRYHDLNSGRNGSIIISERGGHVLGIFPKNDELNLLWVHPDIKNVLESESKDWNVGGDRFWISPERVFFYKNPALFEGWFCPFGLDPADYTIKESSDTNCTLVSNLSLTNQVNHETYNGKIKRKISIIEEKIKTGVAHVGIEYIDDCFLDKPNLKINGWALGQIISGGPENPGTVLIPVKSGTKPLSYFRTIPDHRIKLIDDSYVTFKIDVDDIYKLAIRPEDIDFAARHAKIGYVLRLPNSDNYGFLVRLSDDVAKSQENCHDAPRDNPNGEIGVIQSYNHESPEKTMLAFGEIELQLNPFKTIDNQSQMLSKHQLFGYIGRKNEIMDVVEKYLGIINPHLY